MDTLNFLGMFLNGIVIGFVVVITLIGIGLIAAITMLVKKAKTSGKGNLPSRRATSPQPNRSHFRTRRKPV